MLSPIVRDVQRQRCSKRGSGDGQRLSPYDYGTTERSFHAFERWGSTLTCTVCTAADSEERQICTTCLFAESVGLWKRRRSYCTGMYAFSHRDRGAHFCLRGGWGKRGDLTWHPAVKHQRPAAKTTNSNCCDRAAAQVKQHSSTYWHEQLGWKTASSRSTEQISKKGIKLILKTIGNRKGDCAWSCSRWQTQPEKICKLQSTNQYNVRSEWHWFVRCNLQIFSGCVCHLEQLHAQSPFLFPIVFSINYYYYWGVCLAMFPFELWTFTIELYRKIYLIRDYGFEVQLSFNAWTREPFYTLQDSIQLVIYPRYVDGTESSSNQEAKKLPGILSNKHIIIELLAEYLQLLDTAVKINHSKSLYHWLCTMKASKQVTLPFRSNHLDSMKASFIENERKLAQPYTNTAVMKVIGMEPYRHFANKRMIPAFTSLIWLSQALVSSKPFDHILPYFDLEHGLHAFVCMHFS